MFSTRLEIRYKALATSACVIFLVASSPHAVAPADLQFPPDFKRDPLTTSECECTITADEVESNNKTLFYYASGHAVASIADQNSRLEADTIRYSDLDRILDARGNVRITRNNVVSTYSEVRFKIGSSYYLVTEPRVRVFGPKMVARKKEKI